MIAKTRIRTLSRQLILAAAMCAVWCAAPVQAASKPRHDASSLVDTEAQRYKAMVEHDVPALEKLLSDEAVYVHTTGWKQTKAEHLADIAKSTAVYRKIDMLEQDAKVYGDIGIIQGKTQFTAGPDKPISYQLSYVTNYVWRDKRWQMVSFNCARIPAEGALPPGVPPGAGPPKP